MAIQTINIGSSANKGDGDPLRTAFKKINENFAELDTTNTVRDITGSVFADDSTLLVDGVNGKIVGPIESTSILPGNGLTDIGSTANRFYNAWFTGQVETDSVLANVFYGPLTGNVTGNVTGDVSGTAGAVAFSGITGKPTTLAGYGITDGGGGSGGAAFTNIGIGADDSTIRTINEGESFLIKGGTAITTASDAEGNITVTGVAQDFTFASLTSKPSTISGYGITDALALGTTASTALAGNTALFDGDYGSLSNTPTLFDGVFASLTSKPSTISGYGITDAYTKTEVDNLTTTLDGDLTGSVFGDDSTLLVDGNNNKIVGVVDTTSIRTSEDKIALGYLAGQTTQGAGSVAIGLEAGKTTQSNIAVAIGSNAGLTNQGTESVAIGRLAGKLNQGAQTIAIGPEAGRDDQGANGIALGHEAGRADQAGYGIAIGEKSGNSNQGIRGIAIGRSSGKTDQGTKAVAIGDASGYATQGAGAIAIGDLAGETNQAANGIALGEKAGNIEQSIECIAIGKNAGAGASVTATYVSGGVSGDPITMVVDDTTGIIPGMRITGTGFTYTLLEQQQKVLSVDNATTITIDAIANNGTPSGTLTFKSAQEFYSIAIGSSAGLTSQNAGAVAIGYQAGMTAQMGAVAVGSRAGEVTQGNGGVAVGVDAGRTNQGLHGIAIGKFAGGSNQSQKGIAIGYQTGQTSQGEYSIAIGERAGETNQHANTIILNASTSPLNSVQTDQFIVKPVRSSAGTTHLQYNSSTGEITHLDTITATIVATTATPPTANADPGDTGEIRYDDNYLYIKTASGWKRTALSGIV